jgi:hypothetical protein
MGWKNWRIIRLSNPPAIHFVPLFIEAFLPWRNGIMISEADGILINRGTLRMNGSVAITEPAFNHADIPASRITDHGSPFTVHCLLFTVYCSLFTNHLLPPPPPDALLVW